MTDDFDAATHGYETAMLNYDWALHDLVEKRHDLAQARYELSMCEAEVVANGGHGDYVIDGKNGEVRDAQTKVALYYHERYRNALERVRDLEHKIGDIEAEVDTAANRMSLHRRRMDAIIAGINRASIDEVRAGYIRKEL